VEHENVYRALRSVRQLVKNIIDENGPVGNIRDRVRSLFFSDREKPKMRLEDRAYLQEVYREPNEALADWIGRNLSHWT
jgi:hypothetical protein